MKVIHLGRCRELLSRWNEVKKAILSGRIRGFSLTLMRWDGREVTFLGGEYMEDPEAARNMAVRAAWKLSQDMDGTNGGLRQPAERPLL